MRLVAAILIAAIAAGCDPCAGTPSCTGEPEVSYSGQFIERMSGAAVAGVVVRFVRDEGVLLATDTARAVSDDDGFFTIRAGALAEGTVTGTLIVDPPDPNQTYSVDGITLTAQRRRGDGGILGRLVVDPYLQLLGEVRDLATGQLVRGASVHVRVRNTTPIFGGLTDFDLTTDVNGRFLWEPEFTLLDTISADIEVRSSRWPRPMRVHRAIAPQYLDGPPSFLPLNIGPSMRHSGLASRRGSGPGVDGITIEFVRQSGIRISPDSFVVAASPDGIFILEPRPLDSGFVMGRLSVRAPGYPVENYQISMSSRDEGEITYMGQFGYGAAALIRAIFTQRASGLPVEEGTHVRVSRVGGLATLTPPLAADSGIRIVERGGLLSYGAGTETEGEVIFDLEVRFPSPIKWDTIPGIRVPARSSSVIDTLRFTVGPP
jgi:hypothetical protein